MVVGETTQIGSDVKTLPGRVVHRASLGAGQALRGKKRHPTIEDGVCINAGTTIMGGDTVIGANSTIGANVFLTKSVHRIRCRLLRRKIQCRTETKTRARNRTR